MIIIKISMLVKMSLFDEHLAKLLEPGNDQDFGEELKYGENPHQRGWAKLNEAFEGPTLRTQHSGPPMGYNNYLDGVAALDVLVDMDERAVVVIKHTQPCGLATGQSASEAFSYAWDGDDVSAFGSFVGFNRPVDLTAAMLLKGKFVEGLIAPSYDDEALKWLSTRKKRTRVLETGRMVKKPGIMQRYKHGITLTQEIDDGLYSSLEVVAGHVNLVHHSSLVDFAITAAHHIGSNAIAVAHSYLPGLHALLGIGSGQPNRVDAVARLAIPKAIRTLDEHYCEGDAKEYLGKSRVFLASDAFFPFPDGIEKAYEFGIRNVVAPKGSKNDDSVVARADELGMNLLFYDRRHFRH
jgi:phosphoribosylaminoimidazolecarboxamide formyltransferase / IMP cyclohydrolase